MRMKDKQNLDERFPNIAYWVNNQGVIEIGQDRYSTSMIRLLDEGGQIWEGKTHYKTLDSAFKAAEQAISDGFD